MVGQTSMALSPSNSSKLDQLALNGFKFWPVFWPLWFKGLKMLGVRQSSRFCCMLDCCGILQWYLRILSHQIVLIGWMTDNAIVPYTVAQKL